MADAVHKPADTRGVEEGLVMQLHGSHLFEGAFAGKTKLCTSASAVIAVSNNSLT